YDDLVKASYVHKELYEVRNFHQAFEHGRRWGLIESGLQFVTGGSGIFGNLRAEQAGHEKMKKLHVFNRKPRFPGDVPQAPAQKVDNKLCFDKVSDVYRS